INACRIVASCECGLRPNYSPGTSEPRELRMHSTYNSWLVGLSIGVAILVSFTSLRLASRVAESKGSAGRAWLILGAFSMGVGIWAMHFIGMLAFSLPIQLRYQDRQQLESRAETSPGLQRGDGSGHRHHALHGDERHPDLPRHLLRSG